MRSGSLPKTISTNPEKSEGNGKLDALRKKIASLEAAIALETLKRKKRDWKEYEHLKSSIGGACLAAAAQNADFDLVLKGVLKTAPIIEADRKILRAKGWL